MIVTMESVNQSYDPLIALIHGANLVFIDSLTISTVDVESPRDTCLKFLLDLIGCKLNNHTKSPNIVDLFNTSLQLRIENNSDKLRCGPFSIRKGDYRPQNHAEDDNGVYCLDSQTTASNLLRIMRCLMMDMPVMLEGSPGVGKTSMVEALGRFTRNRVVRINLSEQTDLNELFGADLPCVSETDSNVQRFQWHDGPFLMALKKVTTLFELKLSLLIQKAPYSNILPNYVRKIELKMFILF